MMPSAPRAASLSCLAAIALTGCMHGGPIETVPTPAPRPPPLANPPATPGACTGAAFGALTGAGEAGGGGGGALRKAPSDLSATRFSAVILTVSVTLPTSSLIVSGGGGTAATSSVLASNQVAFSASTCGLSGQPNQAPWPVARIAIWLAGFTQSAPECQVWNICQPPWPGGVFWARRDPTVPQSVATKSTFMPSCFNRSAVTSPFNWGWTLM